MAVEDAVVEGATDRVSVEFTEEIDGFREVVRAVVGVCDEPPTDNRFGFVGERADARDTVEEGRPVGVDGGRVADGGRTG